MTNEREPLWSNQRIRDRYHALVPSEADMGEMEYWNVLRDVGERVSYELRDDYEAALANQYQRIERFVELVDQLEAQLAQRWQPLPDGSYDIHLSNGNINEFRVNDDSITVIAFDYYGNAMDSGWVSIGDYRLCRLVERAEPQPLDMPDGPGIVTGAGEANAV